MKELNDILVEAKNFNPWFDAAVRGPSTGYELYTQMDQLKSSFGDVQKAMGVSTMMEGMNLADDTGFEFGKQVEKFMNDVFPDFIDALDDASTFVGAVQGATIIA